VAGSDDIVVLGGSRRLGQEREEAIEELFRAEYPSLVGQAFALLGDIDRAEQVAIQAFADLWRRWRQSGVEGLGRQYLETSVTRLAGEAGAGSPAGPGVSGELPAVDSVEPLEVGSDERPDVDVERGWREFEALRARTTAARRRNLKALLAVAAVAAVAVAYPLLADRRNASQSAPPQLVTLRPTNNPNAVVARLGLSGVISVAGDSAQAWVIRQIPRIMTVEQPAAASSYQLVAIDLRTNDVTYRLNLGRRPRAIAVGVGRLWMTTPGGQEGGQIERLDPASGRVVQKLHLRAGSCSQLSFSFGQLYAACTAWPAGTGIWAINPITGRAALLGSPVRGFIVSLLAAPRTVWYVHDYAGVSGRARSSGRSISVQGPKFVKSLASPGTGGLAYDAGSIWAMGSKQRLTRIDELTGKVLDTFNYQNFGMSPTCGLDFFTAAEGWLWFLENGCPFSGVLRVSEDTGVPVGGIWIPPNSCGEQSCSLIFATPGSVWVPTTDQLVRIEPAAMPTQEPANRPDADSHLPS
jgi:DNA-directed RNA polymerase specialized sigma24 family protein